MAIRSFITASPLALPLMVSTCVTESAEDEDDACEPLDIVVNLDEAAPTGFETLDEWIHRLPGSGSSPLGWLDEDASGFTETTLSWELTFGEDTYRLTRDAQCRTTAEINLMTRLTTTEGYLMLDQMQLWYVNVLPFAEVPERADALVLAEGASAAWLHVEVYETWPATQTGGLGEELELGVRRTANGLEGTLVHSSIIEVDTNGEINKIKYRRLLLAYWPF